MIIKKIKETDNNIIEETYDYDETTKTTFVTTKNFNIIREEMPNDIDFNDEIESIEYIGKGECLDIEVSDDHLFYANNILTKNSKSVADCADTVVGILMPSELRKQNIQIWKILKNRYGGIVDQKVPLKVNFARAMIYEMDQEMELQGNNFNTSNINAEKARAKKRNKIKVDVEDSEVENELDSLLDE
jgi:hypothetical protein